jgi:hypothetical protein
MTHIVDRYPEAPNRRTVLALTCLNWTTFRLALLHVKRYFTIMKSTQKDPSHLFIKERFHSYQKLLE